MGKYTTGKFALRVSDRSGQSFPYDEMVQEWNGSWVHVTEFESKHPQLDPKNHPPDRDWETRKANFPVVY